MAISHAGHNHPATPAARKACRNSNGNPRVTRIESDGYIADHIRKAAATYKIKAQMDRRYDENMARIQPRRSGARVSATSSACVQAALHTRGKCACGWESWAA